MNCIELVVTCTLSLLWEDSVMQTFLLVSITLVKLLGDRCRGNLFVKSFIHIYLLVYGEAIISLCNLHRCSSTYSQILLKVNKIMHTLVNLITIKYGYFKSSKRDLNVIHYAPI